MYCTHCGKKIEDDMNFCPYCGQVMGSTEIDIKKEESVHKNIRKINSDSENQPTSALVLLGSAIMVFGYAIVCCNDKSEDVQILGLIIGFVAVLMAFFSYRKMKAHEEQKGLSGIGYIAYLICRVLLPIMEIIIGFVFIFAIVSLLMFLFKR